MAQNRSELALRLSRQKVRTLARSRGLSVSELLGRAAVSRTAYYSLARRATIFPRSVQSLARALGVAVPDLLEEVEPPAPPRVRERLRRARRICELEPDASFENVWHTLCLLDIPPVERLNRSLIRGRATSVHR